MFNPDFPMKLENSYENSALERHTIARTEYVGRLRQRDAQARSGLWAVAGREIMRLAECAAMRLGTALLDWAEARRVAARAQTV